MICLRRFKCSGPPVGVGKGVQNGGLWADVPRPQNHGADVLRVCLMVLGQESSAHLCADSQWSTV